MRWISCGITWKEKDRRRKERLRRKQEWHKWFAWYPATIDETKDYHKVKVWLEFVDRRGEKYYSGFGEDYTYWWVYDYKVRDCRRKD